MNSYDVIIVGGSYSGLAAAMALGRALRKVLVIDSGLPCNRQTPQSHNFLTRDGSTPSAIAAIAREQVAVYDTVEFRNGLVTGATGTTRDFMIELETGERISGRKLVFATGIKDQLPALQGFADCWGISVLHCPYCHGYEVRQQKTGIFANGEAAFELAILLSNWTQDLTIYTNGKSSLTNPQLEKLEVHGIGVVESEIGQLNHEQGYLTSLLFKNGELAPVKVIYAKLPFVQHSAVPETMGCELTPEGYIKIDPAYRTNIPGVFACGDNTTRMRTVANAVAMGTSTGMMVNKEMKDETFHS